MEIRNELLNILYYAKNKNESDNKLYLEMLLERFEIDIKRQLEDIEHKQKELKENAELLEDIKKELNIK